MHIIGSPILGWSLEKLRLQAEAVKKSGDLPDPTPTKVGGGMPNP